MYSLVPGITFRQMNVYLLHHHKHTKNACFHQTDDSIQRTIFQNIIVQNWNLQKQTLIRFWLS